MAGFAPSCCGHTLRLSGRQTGVKSGEAPQQSFDRAKKLRAGRTTTSSKEVYLPTTTRVWLSPPENHGGVRLPARQPCISNSRTPPCLSPSLSLARPQWACSSRTQLQLRVNILSADDTQESTEKQRRESYLWRETHLGDLLIHGGNSETGGLGFTATSSTPAISRLTEGTWKGGMNAQPQRPQSEARSGSWLMLCCVSRPVQGRRDPESTGGVSISGGSGNDGAAFPGSRRGGGG